jgi:putative DNA primase/helicase
MTARADLSAIAHALGGEVSGGQVMAPGPGHGPKDRSLSIRLNAGAPDGLWTHSFSGDDWRACREYVRARLRIGPDLDERKRPAPNSRGEQENIACRERAAFVIKKIEAIVRELAPLCGTPAQRYLREARGIDVTAIGDVLERRDAVGWHPAVLFKQPGHDLDGRRLGCIIGVMTDAVTAKPTGAITRTYLDANGRKIGKARTLGRPAGIVRLSPDEDVLGGLHLAEGLETGLSAISIGLRPLWATGSTSFLKAFPLLYGIEALSIVADHDVNGAGEEAARKLEFRYRRAGREVRIFRSDQIGDFNDVLRADVR